MNLQESIRRILREEDYSPAGKEITPNNIVIHKSNPVWRENILKTGLQVSAGECYKTYVGYGVKCKPAIFATNSTNKRAWFDSTYDDDIWEINTEMIPDVKWYKDRHFESRSKHIVTFQDIPKEALTLKYEGTGSGDVEKWDKDSPNIVRESIKKILREETESGKYTKIAKAIADDFKTEEFVCDIDVSYYNEMYEIAVKIDRKEFEKKYEKLDVNYATILMKGYLDRLKRNIRQEIKNVLPVDVLVWFKQINCDKGLNESEDGEEKKIQKNLRAIRQLLDTIDVDGLCEMWVEYNPEDGDYEIRSKTTVRYYDMADMAQELGYIEDTIRSWKLKTYVFSPYYVENCEDEIEYLNESEGKKGKYINALEDLTEDFKNEDCVCDIEIKYRPEEFRDAYLITVVLGNGDLDDKFNGTSWRISDYRTKLKRKITNGVMEFLPIPFYIEFKQTPRCYKDLQESEEKKPKLLSTIEEDGLYQIMKDTGLSLKQIKSKIGELPRELLERYIKDFLEKDEIGWDLSIQISPNKIVDSFYLSDGVVTIEVNEVDSRGRVVAGSFERLSVLSDEEIFSLVDEMSQINFDNHFDLW